MIFHQLPFNLMLNEKPVEMLKRALREEFLSSYAAVASEYYDENCHPTCRNFRDASRAFVQASLDGHSLRGLTLEVGAGQSLLGELSEFAGLRPERLLLLDSSIEMLSHSQRFEGMAHLVVSDACRLPFADKSISLIVAALADPFNVEAFWLEVARCLRIGGRCLFTTPSYEWASSFRLSSRNEQEGAAYFELKNGQRLYLPSIVKSPIEQEKMIHDVGLEVSKVSNLTVDMISGPHSKKIQDCESVVTGYIAVSR
jgi:SAM-dependent methyltransferase